MLLPLSAIPDGTAVEAKKANVGLTTYREGVYTMRKLNPRNWLPNVKMNIAVVASPSVFRLEAVAKFTAPVDQLPDCSCARADSV